MGVLEPMLRAREREANRGQALRQALLQVALADRRLREQREQQQYLRDRYAEQQMDRDANDLRARLAMTPQREQDFLGRWNQLRQGIGLEPLSELPDVVRDSFARGFRELASQVAQRKLSPYMAANTLLTVIPKGVLAPRLVDLLNEITVAGGAAGLGAAPAAAGAEAEKPSADVEEVGLEQAAAAEAKRAAAAPQKIVGEAPARMLASAFGLYEPAEEDIDERNVLSMRNDLIEHVEERQHLDAANLSLILRYDVALGAIPNTPEGLEARTRELLAMAGRMTLKDRVALLNQVRELNPNLTFTESIVRELATAALEGAQGPEVPAGAPAAQREERPEATASLFGEPVLQGKREAGVAREYEVFVRGFGAQGRRPDGSWKEPEDFTDPRNRLIGQLIKQGLTLNQALLEVNRREAAARAERSLALRVARGTGRGGGGGAGRRTGTGGAPAAADVSVTTLITQHRLYNDELKELLTMQGGKMPPRVDNMGVTIPGRDLSAEERQYVKQRIPELRNMIAEIDRELHRGGFEYIPRFQTKPPDKEVQNPELTALVQQGAQDKTMSGTEMVRQLREAGATSKQISWLMDNFFWGQAGRPKPGAHKVK